MSLFSELKRRNVFRVAIAYLALAWLLTEVAGTLFPTFGIPDWGVRFLVIVFALGFFPALIISWIYELTPEGIKREKDVFRDASITHITARRLDVFTIGLISLALAFVVFDRLWLSPRLEPSAVPTASASIENVQTVVAEQVEARYPPNSIAVLPFVNMSPDPDQEYFSDGISEELLNLLAKIPEFQVTSRSSSFSFKNEKIDLPEIARNLEVAYVLEGSVRKAGSQVRITAQLIDTQNDTHLWSETYDRELTDDFALQDEVAGAITSALAKQIGVDVDLSRIKSPTLGQEAYEALLRARYLLAQRSSKSIEGAIEELLKAVDLNPESALIHAELVIAYGIQRYYVRVPREEMLSKAVPHALEAMLLNPDLAESQAAMGIIRAQQGQTYETIDHYLNAVRINPNYSLVYVWLGMLMDDIGDYQKAFEMRSKARRLDPLSPAVLRAYITDLYNRGRYAEAKQELRKLAVIDPLGHSRSSALVEGAGVTWSNETLALLDTLLLDPEQSRLRRSLATRFAILGMEREAVEVNDSIPFTAALILGQLGPVIEQSSESNPSYSYVHPDLGLALAAVGNYEKALPYLEEEWRLIEGRVTRRGDFTETEATALITIYLATGREDALDSILAALRDNVQRYRETGYVTRNLFSPDYEEGLAEYFSGERERGLKLISQAVSDGYYLMPNAAFMRFFYDDPEFAKILEYQLARQEQEREKFLAVVCNDNPYEEVWQPAEETCEQFASSRGLK